MDHTISDTSALDSGLPSAPQHANGPVTATTLEKGTPLPSLSYQTTIARDRFSVSRSMIVLYTPDGVPLHLHTPFLSAALSQSNDDPIPNPILQFNSSDAGV